MGCGALKLPWGITEKKTKRVTLYGKSKKEVLEKLTQILHQKQTGGLLEPTKVTLGEWLDRWLNDYMKPHLRQNTWGDYESIIRVHIKPALGQRLLRKL